MVLRARTIAGEESVAATRTVLVLTAAVGAMAAVASAAAGDPLVLIAVPAAALMLLLSRGATSAAGYAAAVVWLGLVPQAPEEAMLVPLAMSVGCLAIALGPDRLLGWVKDDFRGERGATSDRASGWIEEA